MRQFPAMRPSDHILRGWREWLTESLGIAARGVAMGIAEVIPGVSGGTIALITGIYERLLNALAAYSLSSPRILLRDGFGAFHRTHDLSFVAALALGMIIGLVVFARVLGYFLDTYGPVLWGFIFGMIAASLVSVARRTTLRSLVTFGVAGAVAAILVSSFAPTSADPTYPRFLLGGALAASAWILPGISGSLVLVLLGLWQPLLAALNAARLDIILVTVAGMAVGLLLVVKLLARLLHRYPAAVFATLTGLMAGSLVRLWPWRVDDAMVLPATYRADTGVDPMIAWVAVAACLGIAAIALLAKSGRSTSH